MVNNPHAKLALKHGGTGANCESCHGPGQAHVEGGGDVTKIVRFDKLTPTEVDKTCLACHANTHPNFLRSPHAKAGVNCLSCHSIHKSVTESKLLSRDAAEALLPVPHRHQAGTSTCPSTTR